MNNVLERALDVQIDSEDYPLKYPLPYRYTKRKPWYEGDICGMLRDEENQLVQVMYDKKFLRKVFKFPDVLQLFDILNRGLL